MIKQQIEQRLKQLDWTLYKLAKQVSKLRAARSGENESAAVRYHSAIDKALEMPERSKLSTIQDIVEVMGGKLQISWSKADPTKETTQYQVKYYIKDTLVSYHFYASFRDALHALVMYQGEHKHAYLEVNNECVCTTEDIQEFLGWQQANQSVESVIEPTPSWVCIEECPTMYMYPLDAHTAAAATSGQTNMSRQPTNTASIAPTAVMPRWKQS